LRRTVPAGLVSDELGFLEENDLKSSIPTCPHCGAENRGNLGSDGRVYCEYCDAVLSIESTTGKTRQYAQPASSALTFTNSPSQGLPPEFRRLSRPKVSPSLESSGCGLIFGLFWTLFSAVFVIFGLGFTISSQQEYNRLVQEGISVLADITELEIDDSGDSTSYYVHYQYRARVQGDLSRFEDQDSVSASFFRSLQVGQQIEILYAESDPKVTAIKSEFEPPSLLFSLIFSGMGGLFLLIGLAMIYGAFKAQVQLRQLRSQGRQTQGFVFDRWKDKDSDGDPTYFVAFAFKVNFEIITRAEQNKILYDKCQIGDPLIVRYLSDDPQICQARIER
jgi:hypothetical protein